MATGDKLRNSNNVPKWLACEFNNEQVQKISDFVARAEEKTTGEIVPIIVKQSSPTEHIVWILMLLFVSIAFAFDLPNTVESHLRWETNFNIHLLLTIFTLIFLTILFLISKFLCQLSFVQRFFLSSKDINKYCNQRALLEFYKNNLHKTQESTGIIIFISVLERYVVILGDSGINSKLKPEDWHQIHGDLILDLKNKQMYLGLEKAIKKCAVLLSQHFPNRTINKNELSNQLIICD